MFLKVTLFALGTVGCSGCDTRTPADGGSDAAIEAKGDAADAAPPGCYVSDAAAIDAGAPFVGDWRLMNGVPCNCDLYVANAPSQDISIFKWAPCTSGRAGCVRLVVDWTTNAGWRIAFPNHPVREIQGTEYLTYTRRFPFGVSSVSAGITITSDMMGTAHFAQGVFATDPQQCGMVQAPLLGGIGFAVLTTSPSEVLGRALDGQPENALSHDHTQSQLGLLPGPTGGVVREVVAVGGALMLSTTAPDSVVVYDPNKDQINLVGADGGRVQAENVAPALNGVVALDASPTRGLFFVGPDGSYARVYAPPSGRATFDVGADESQNSNFVWLEGQSAGLDYTDIALYREPYTTSSSGSQPVRITTIDKLYNFGAGMVVNAGMALVIASSTTAELIRLSDGWAWSIPSEVEDHWAQPIWVNTSEVWIAVADAQSTLEDSIVKIPLATLGAPTIAPH